MNEPRINFQLTKLIVDAYYPPDEFVLVIIYAPLGYGKSSYQFKVSVETLQRIYHVTEKEAWEALKSLVVFHPEQFFEKLDQARELGFYKLTILNWDDAGLWLYALDWNDPFIEAFTKWLNVARTSCTALLCSTPSPVFLLKKLREFPSAITVRIVKNPTNPSTRWRRLAKGYRHWIMPDLKKTRVKPLFHDIYTCRMPNAFYKWYKPLRDTYAKMAQRLMEEKWEQAKIDGKTKALLLRQYPEFKLPNLKRL